MKTVVSSFGWVMLVAFLLGGGSEEQRVANESDPDDGNEAIAIAWEFVKARSWQGQATDDWRGAEVTRVVIDDTFYQMNDESVKNPKA